MQATLGTIVTWTVRNAFINREALIAALAAEKIYNVSIKETRQATYLKRALEQATQDGLIRKIGENMERVAFAIVAEKVDFANATWRGESTEAVTLYKKTGEISFLKSDELTLAVTNRMQLEAGALLSAEVGSVIRNVCVEKLQGIALREGGGAYFVPDTHVKGLDSLERALTAVTPAETQIAINRFSVLAGKREVADIATLFTAAVMQELTRVKAEVQELLPDIVTARPSTFAARAKQMAELSKQVNAYTALLGVDFADLQQKCGKTGELLQRVRVACVNARDKARRSAKA